MGKGFNLAQYNIFAKDPGFIEKDIRNILAVTPSDVTRVYQKYIKGQPYVATSFVPKGKRALALEGSKKADVVEEKIVQGAENAVDPNVKADYEKTPSTFDRSVEPPMVPRPRSRFPQYGKASLRMECASWALEHRVPLYSSRS